MRCATYTLRYILINAKARAPPSPTLRETLSSLVEVDRETGRHTYMPCVPGALAKKTLKRTRNALILSAHSHTLLCMLST